MTDSGPNHPYNRSSPAKNENSDPRQRWRIRLEGLVDQRDLRVFQILLV